MKMNILYLFIVLINFMQVINGDGSVSECTTCCDEKLLKAYDACLQGMPKFVDPVISEKYNCIYLRPFYLEKDSTASTQKLEDIKDKTTKATTKSPKKNGQDNNKKRDEKKNKDIKKNKDNNKQTEKNKARNKNEDKKNNKNNRGKRDTKPIAQVVAECVSKVFQEMNLLTDDDDDPNIEVVDGEEVAEKLINFTKAIDIPQKELLANIAIQCAESTATYSAPKDSKVSYVPRAYLICLAVSSLAVCPKNLLKNDTKTAAALKEALECDQLAHEDQKSGFAELSEEEVAQFIKEHNETTTTTTKSKINVKSAQIKQGDKKHNLKKGGNAQNNNPKQKNVKSAAQSQKQQQNGKNAAQSQQKGGQAKSGGQGNKRVAGNSQKNIPNPAQQEKNKKKSG